MKYLDHELDPKLKAQVREAEQDPDTVVAPDWGLAKALRPHPLAPASVPADEQEASEGNDLPTGTEPVVLDDVVQAHSLPEAEVKLNLIARNDEKLRGLKPPFEFYFDQITPIPVEKNEINTVRAMDNCQTYSALREKMFEAKDRLPEAVWRAIDERITKAINEALTKNLSLKGWAIDTFYDDYPDLVDALQSSYSEQLVGIFEGHSTQVIGSALSVLSGESFAKYLRTIQGDSNGKDSGGRLLAFRDRCSVTYVPWKYSELSLDLTRGGMVPEAEMPELYAAMDAILERTFDHPVTFARRYLMTTDKKLIEVRRGYLGKESVLLFDA